MDHITSSNATFILETPDSELPLCHCFNFADTGCLYFLEEEYTHIVEVQTEWIHILKTLRAREFNPFDFFRGRTGVCGLGSIRCVLISMGKDKTLSLL